MPATLTDDPASIYPGLRPAGLDEFVGQDRIRERLQIAIEAVKLRNLAALDHVLLSGPPGLGKTTLAGIVSTAMRTNLVKTSGPALSKAADLVGVLSTLEPGDVVFIDEIHRVPVPVREALYPAMEDGHIDLPLDGGKAVQINLPPFTLVGATTHKGMIAGPFVDRFGLDYALQLYEPAELWRIVMRSAGVFGAMIDEPAALLIAQRSRGTPRIANTLLKRALDYALVKTGRAHVATDLTHAALDLEGIDSAGLDDLDRQYLHTLCTTYGGGPAGSATLAATMQQAKQTLLDSVEPYLLSAGFLAVTPSGRKATPKAFVHLRLGTAT